MKEAQRISDELAEKQRTAAGSIGELAQLAATPADYRRMVAAARKTYAEGGAKTEEEAYKLQFALESAGLGKQRETVSSLQSTGLVGNATDLVNAAAALTSALGEAETGKFQDIVSKAFGASLGAPARAEEIVQASAQSGAQAAALGISDEELLASVATIAKTFGSAPEAGTRVQSLLKQIEKEGIAKGQLPAGLSIQGYVGEIDKMIAGGQDIRSILGSRQEAIDAYRLLSQNADRFTDNLDNINNAVETSAIDQKLAMAASVIPESRAAQLRQRAQASAELAGSREASLANLVETLRQEREQEVRRRGGTSLDVASERRVDDVARFVLGDELYAKSAAARGIGTQETRQAIDDLTKSTSTFGAVASRLWDTVKNMPGAMQLANKAVQRASASGVAE